MSTVRERNAIRRREKAEQKARLTASIVDGIIESAQVDDWRYPLERVEETGQSVPGRRPAGRTGGVVSSLTESFAENQHVPRERLRVRRKVVRNGRETYESV